MLEATDKVAQARITASENYKNHIYDVARSCRVQKEVQLKKVVYVYLLINFAFYAPNKFYFAVCTSFFTNLVKFAPYRLKVS